MNRIGQTIRIVSFYIFVIGLFLLGTTLGNKTVSVIAQSIPVPHSYTIVIDPGHGGEDGGATSCTGKLESAYNLEIALRLNDFFHLMGYRTILIRETDSSVYTRGETISQKKVSDLKERVRIVNETPGSILISIHQNIFSDSRYSGAQVFFSASPGSEAYAKALQEQLVSQLNPGSNRMSKKGSGIYLLEKCSSPGILVECGFLSNPQEEANLSTPSYQQKLCAIIVASTISWLNNA